MTSAIAAIHAGCKQLGIDEDGRRAVYARVTGKASLSVMSSAEKENVVLELRRMGFKPASKRANGRLKLSGKYAGKLQSLWIAGWNLGVFRERDDAALEAFVKRQTGLDAVRFCHDPADARKAIEALKAILAREVGVDWSTAKVGPLWINLPTYQIAVAQWAILNPASPRDFWPVVTDLLDQDETHRDLTSAEWIAVMNAFGEKIRAAKKGGA